MPHQPGHIDWQDMGWSGEAAQSTDLSSLLGQFFKTPEDYTKYFEDYDATGEQAARQAMMGKQSQAQEQARGSLWKQFEQARQGRGGGFGGRGRAMKTAMGGVFKGLEQQREAGQLGLQEDIRGMREGYRDDVMGMIGSLVASGAEGVSSGPQTGYNTDIYGSGFDEATGSCSPGYYMAAEGSGQQGCIPVSGGGGEDDYVQNPDLDPAGQCAAKGGIWFNNTCDFPGGSGGDGGVDDTFP